MSAFHLAVADVVMVALLSAVASAATAIAYVGYKGNPHNKMPKICNNFDRFCHHTSGAIVTSFVGVIVFTILTTMAIYSINKRARVDSSKVPSKKHSSIRTSIIVAEMAMEIILVSILVCAVVIQVPFNLKDDPCETMTTTCRSKLVNTHPSTSNCSRTGCGIKICRVQVFSEELKRAMCEFQKDTKVGCGTYSYVFKVVLSDDRVIVVKRAIVATDVQK